MASIKRELEDLSLKVLDPEAYQDLTQTHPGQARGARGVPGRRSQAGSRRGSRRRASRPRSAGGRSTSTRSTTKMEAGRDFESIYDLFGLRIITHTRNDCYRALGVAHDLFTPVAERFKDYVATPKSNLYQSLHTTVLTDDGEMVEVQIRTREMHRTAETGVAAHYRLQAGRARRRGAGRQARRLRRPDRRLAAHRHRRRVHGLPAHRALPGGSVRLHAAARAQAAAEGRDRARLRVPDPHRGRRAHGGGARQRRAGAAALRAAQRRHGRDHHLARRRSRTRTGCTSCARPARASKGPALAPPAPPAGQRRRSGARCSSASSSATATRLTRRSSRRSRVGSDCIDVEQLYARLAEGQISLTQVVRKIAPEKEGFAERLAKGPLEALGLTKRPIGGDAHPRHRQRHAQLRALLPAGAGRSRDRHRHARARRVGPPPGLSQHVRERVPAERTRRGRVGRQAGRDLPGAPRRLRQRPHVAARRHRQGDRDRRR